MDDLRERVEAVERALTEGEGDLSALAEGAARAERVDGLASAVEALREDVADLEAATQALRGYAGSVRSVNESVEQRADAAVAAVDSLEERVEALEANGPAPPDDGRTDSRGATGAGPVHGDPDPAHRDGDGHDTSRGARAGGCPACGHGGDLPGAATDGGRRGTRDLGGFDPDGATEPVRIPETVSDGTARTHPENTAPQARQNGTEAGFLQRIRELL